MTPRFLSLAMASLLAWAALVGPVRAQTPAPAPAAVVAPASTNLPLVPARQISGAIPAASEGGDNPYGLRALWNQGDLVARATLLMLVLMSLASWYVLISRLLAQRTLAAQTVAAQRAFAGGQPVRQGAAALPAASPFRYITDQALQAVQRHESVADDVDLNTWLAQNIERLVGDVQASTQNGLALLATVGATAPFVGLFGTVWGIYNALVKIGASGQASIDKVAGPVGEALIMTAIGLAVAVPAVLGYNWLVRRNRVALDRVRAFGSELHTQLLAAVGKSRREAAAQTPVAL